MYRLQKQGRSGRTFTVSVGRAAYRKNFGGFECGTLGKEYVMNENTYEEELSFEVLDDFNDDDDGISECTEEERLRYKDSTYEIVSKVGYRQRDRLCTQRYCVRQFDVGHTAHRANGILPLATRYRLAKLQYHDELHRL